MAGQNSQIVKIIGQSKEMVNLPEQKVNIYEIRGNSIRKTSKFNYVCGIIVCKLPSNIVSYTYTH